MIKAKKRRLGRAQKTIGDYCLLAGSPVDANAHYSTALELTRLTADFFWYAGAMEGSVCALLVSMMQNTFKSFQNDSQTCHCAFCYFVCFGYCLQLMINLSAFYFYPISPHYCGLVEFLCTHQRNYSKELMTLTYALFALILLW